MVEGARKSRSMKRVSKRIPSGKSVVTYRRAREGKPTCPSGRPLLGTARGNKTDVRALTKTQRRPSRPYGGVLSSPAMRSVMVAQAHQTFQTPQGTSKAYAAGTVCMKIAGRDAGKLCVITEQLDKKFVKIDGFTRPRKCNIAHLEPTGKRVDVKGDSKAIQAALNA